MLATFGGIRELLVSGSCPEYRRLVIDSRRLFSSCRVVLIGSVIGALSGNGVLMSSNVFKTWAQISMGALVCLLIVFGFYIFSR